VTFSLGCPCVDTDTLAAYDRAADAFAEDWHTQPVAADLHALVRRFFSPGRTADIGCGSGRDTAWLTGNGFPSVGYDPSGGLLTEARRRHPGLDFREASLPDLDGIPDGCFTNVFCETVIMHLEPGALVASVHRLLDIAAPGGTLYLSWRVTEGSDRRDEHGRLYAAFDAGLVVRALGAASLLLDEESTSDSSAKTVHRIVARKA
jgi:SAM-dependent methyltransferase